MDGETRVRTSPEPAWITVEAVQVEMCVPCAVQGGSPQRRELYVGEARLLPQLPVRVIAHPGVILRLPEETEQKPDSNEHSERCESELWNWTRATLDCCHEKLQVRLLRAEMGPLVFKLIP